MDNLVQYRLDNAQEKLESAEILLNAGKYKDSIGRSYYAIFSAVRAILAFDHVDFSKTLKDMDKAVENFKIGVVSPKVDLPEE